MIKYILPFAQCLTFIIVSSCFSMENPLEKNKKTEYEYILPNNQKFFSLAFCNQKVFTTGTNGICIYDIKNDKIRKLTDQPTFHIALHPNKQHLAISNEKELAIYNTQTEQKTWMHGSPIVAWKTTPIVFTAQNNTIYAYYKDKLIVYTQDNQLLPQKIHVPFHTRSSQILYDISCHPTKPELLFPLYMQIASLDVNCRSLNDGYAVIQKQDWTRLIYKAEYNQQGNYIGIIDSNKKFCLYNVTNHTFHSFSQSNYISMAFDSYLDILALLTGDGTIEYWNYKILIPIAAIRNYSNNYNMQKIFSRTKRLDFNEKGTLLAIALTNKLFVISTPSSNLIIIYIMLKLYFPKDLTILIVELILHLQNLTLSERI